MADLSKGPLQLGEQRTLCAALEDFHDKATAGFEDIHRHGERRLGQRDDPQVIGRSMAGCRRRHVAQHDIGQITKLNSDRFSKLRVENIGAQNSSAGYGCGLGNINPQDLAAPRPRADPRDCHLSPSSWCAAEIDNPAGGQQQAEPIVKLDQLESGTRTITQPTRLGDVRVVQLPG